MLAVRRIECDCARSATQLTRIFEPDVLRSCLSSEGKGADDLIEKQIAPNEVPTFADANQTHN
jgi:hypothetical protein